MTEVAGSNPVTNTGNIFPFLKHVGVAQRKSAVFSERAFAELINRINEVV
jgi:hypothetical protein